MGHEDGAGETETGEGAAGVQPAVVNSGGKYPGKLGEKNDNVVIWSSLPKPCGSIVGTKGKVCACSLEEGHPDHPKCTTTCHEHVVHKDGVYLTAGLNTVWKEGAFFEGCPSGIEGIVADLGQRGLSRIEWMAVMGGMKDISAAEGEKKVAMIQTFEIMVENMQVLHPIPAELAEEPEEVVLALHPLPQTPMRSRGWRAAPSPTEDAGLSELERLEAFKQEGQKDLRDLNEAISDTMLSVRQLSAHQGQVGAYDPPLGDGLKNLATEVKGLGHITDAISLRQDTLEENNRTALDKLGEVDGDLDSLMLEGGRLDVMDETAKALGVSLREINTRVNDLAARSPVGSRRLAAPVIAPGVTPASFSALETRVATLEVGGRRIENTTSSHALEARLKLLEKKSMHSSADNKVVVIDNGRWTFVGQEGVNTWLEKEAGVPTTFTDFGFEPGVPSQDPLHLLLQAENDGTTTQEQFQQEELYASRVKRSAYATGRASAAQSMLPSCFTTKNGLTLSKIANFVDWNSGDGEVGVKPKMERALVETRTLSMQRIADELRDFPKLRELAGYLLNQTADFIEAFFNWIDTYYRTMVVNMGAKTDKEKAACWKLVHTMVHTVFEVLWETRRPVKQAHTLPRRDALAKYLYWSVRTLEVMKEFQRYHFAEHKRIFPKLMTHIFESHTPKVEFVALKQTCNSNVDKTSSLQSTLDGVLNRLKALERTVNGGGNGGGGGGDDGAAGAKWRNRKNKGEKDKSEG